MENNYTVYIHINKTNGKMYVGITGKAPELRWQNGKGYSNNKYFSNSINKYGWYGFEHEIIASNLNKNEAKKFEILLISKLETMDRSKGYNLTAGGEGISGYKFSDEFKLKASLRMTLRNKIMGNPMLGKISPMRGRKGVLSHLFGKSRSEETKRKISEGQKGKIISEEQKQILREFHTGLKASDATKTKMSESQKGRKHSQETKNKMSKWQIKLSKEQVSEIREKYATGNYRQRKLADEYLVSRDTIIRVINHKGVYKD